MLAVGEAVVIEVLLDAFLWSVPSKWSAKTLRSHAHPSAHIFSIGCLDAAGCAHRICNKCTRCWLCGFTTGKHSSHELCLLHTLGLTQ